MSVSTFLRKRLLDLLNERRIVIWYDSERAFGEFVSTFRAPSCIVISAVESTLQARRSTEAVYRKMNESDNRAEARANLLIYIPRPRGSTPEERQRDPFEVFALAGVAFGTADDERLESLARQAMPHQIEEVTRLFAEGKPTLALLDGLKTSQRYPLLWEALGTESPLDVITSVLCLDDKAECVEKIPGCREELLRLLEAEIGFKPSRKSRSWKTIREQLGTYVVFSEFAFDLPTSLPASLSAVPKADTPYKEKIFSLCARMRSDSILREGYFELARRIESELRLPELLESLGDLGTRDTFAFEEKRYLRQLIGHAERGELPAARAVLEGRKNSVWKEQSDRALLWTVAERGIDFLNTAEKCEASWRDEATDLRAMVIAYTRLGGWAELDRRQRLYEQSATGCTEDEEIAALVDLCRRRYREVALAIQERFLTLVQQEGWPPEEMPRQSQVFDKYVAPLLEQREKTVFFLVDSLRFEMGRDLGEALQELGEVEVMAAAAVLPTTTPCGMAALMPNADSALRLVEVNGTFVPALGTRLLKEGSADRMKLLKEHYGDRCLDLTLEDLLSRFKKYGPQLKSLDFLVVRTQDPDRIAENLGSYRARKYLSDVIGDITTIMRRLVSMGFTRFIVSADHGHVLLTEIPPGDIVEGPSGEWFEMKRRCRLGRSLSTSPGTVILKAGNVGIQGDVEEICVPIGFKVFSAGEAYFHEGISLPETAIPVVIMRAQKRVSGQGKQEISIHYRSDKFTSRVIGLKVLHTTPGLFTAQVRVRIEAYSGSSPKATLIGEAADCEARDETTHEVILQPGVETPVPVLIGPDFSGPKVEIRVIDPQTGVIWARCELKNAMLE